ncbi:hypothetical protein ACEQ8H_002734 [Pleosporales sp. CAS-2024a]
MDSSKHEFSKGKDTKVDTGITNMVADDGVTDVAVGAVEERTTLSTFYRSVLFQMILFGALSLVGPAMGDAISNLGGGGLSTPWLANLANSLSYAMSFCTTILGGPIINRIGIKWACLVAALAMPLYGSAYYVSARNGTESYLLAANLIGGICGGFLYVAETTAMLSYPRPQDRGFYLGIWSAMRSTGSVIGGAINFSTNYNQTGSGGITWGTYLIFVGFECTGPIWALLLSPTPKVRRRDGARVSMSRKVTWKQEFSALWAYLQRDTTWLVFLPAFYSFFYGGTMGTYLSNHFSVRARALSSLLVPVITIPSVIAFGKLLDNTRYWTQLTLYWILGTYSKDVEVASRAGGVFRAFETCGQAVSYGLSSASHIKHVIPLYVNCGILVLMIPSMVMLISRMPKTLTGVVSIEQPESVHNETTKEN